jgi:hypothetical protein
MSRHVSRVTAASSLFGVAVLMLTYVTGCERKERVLDVRTPGGDVTVDRNIDNGRVDVKTTNK